MYIGMLLKNAFRNAWENWMTTVMLLKTRLISHLKSFYQYTLVMALSFGWQLLLFGLANVSNLIHKKYVRMYAKKEIEIVADKFTFSNKRDQSLMPRELIMSDHCRNFLMVQIIDSTRDSTRLRSLKKEVAVAPMRVL